MPLDIVFGLVTSTEDPHCIQQLVRSLGRDCRVVIHHDASKSPTPRFDNPKVTLLPDPVYTEWVCWGFCEAIIKTIRYAVDSGPCDYYQLISGSCLPIRPMEQYRAHIESSPYDVNMDLVSLDDDEQARLSHGSRVFGRRGTLPGRVQERAVLWYLGDDIAVTQRQGLGFEHRRDPPGAPLPLKARIGRMILDAGRAGLLGRHPYHKGIKPYVASTWFGCRRPVAEMLANVDENDPIERYFRSMMFTDEAYLGSRVGNGKFSIGPSNHYISRFNGNSPIPLTENDLPVLRESGAFFARKFPRDAQAPIRLSVLEQLSRNGVVAAPSG